MSVATDFFSASGSQAVTSLPKTPRTTGNIAPTDINAFSATSTTSATLQTVLTISANSGVLSFLAYNMTGTGIASRQLKVTVDGVVVFDDTSVESNNGFRALVGSYDPGTSASFESAVFNSSLLIEHAGDGASATTTTAYRYYLT